MHNVLVVNYLGVQEKINMKISRKKLRKDLEVIKKVVPLHSRLRNNGKFIDKFEKR